MSIVSDDVFTEYLKNETGVTDSLQISAAKNAAEDVVRSYCQRSFETATGTPAARLFGPSSIVGRSIRVDDFASTTGLVIMNNDVVLTADDYQLLPLNGRTANGSYAAYEQIDLYDTTWYTSGNRLYVSVTADWGWTTVPAAVVEAVKIIGKDFVTARTSKFGFSETSAGVVQGGRNWLALNALGQFCRREACFIA